ncbi:cystatin-C [Danio aesculapii]|uniref:cystatin-C n=1 Tax=Danio aesculapii TaxID=1142201 RepID=UPI0024BFF292|nr:cystatin-C [Danio aesculapii]
MDICLLVLVSFLSMFHLSGADQPLEEAVIVARKVELLGGWIDANPDREEVQKAAKEAVEQFNSESKAKKYFKLINVTSARTQVTNRVNFKIEAIIGKTKCHKLEGVNIESCLMAKKQLTCKFEVSLNPMNDDYVVHKIICKRSS